MKILRQIGCIALAAILFSSCCACRSYQKNNRRPLQGTEWQLIQLNGRTVQAEEGRFTITLSDNGRITGMGACNRLTGSYTQDEKRALKIGPLASTRMACPGMEQEGAFFQALESATHYDMDGPMLMLLTNGELRALLQARPAK